MDPYESPQVDPFDPTDTDGEEAPNAPGEQLGVEHGLLFVAGVAVVIWSTPFMWDSQAYQVVDRLTAALWLSILVNGAGIGAVGLAILRRVQKAETFPAQFGHWLLLIIGTGELASLAYSAIERQALRAMLIPKSETELIQDFPAALSQLLFWIRMVPVVVIVLAYRYSPGQILWQRAAIFMLLSLLWVAFLPSLGSLQESWISVGISILLVVFCFLCQALAAGADLLRPQVRDVVHWIGIGCHFGMIVATRLATPT
jgi:hypothetical protein